MKLFKAILFSVVVVLLLTAFTAMAFGAATGEVFGLFSFELVTDFFADVTADQLMVYLFVGLLWLFPQLGPSLLNFLKNTFGLEDKLAHSFIIVFTFLIAGVVIFITGSLKLDGMAFTFGNLMFIGGEIYILSQVSYKTWLQD
ncbi:MAG: hypothetical protein U9N61_10070 [Euryarchaeota archaeon]|nr:hypothetical protein [Euryarchaeota archaeon]